MKQDYIFQFIGIMSTVAVGLGVLLLLPIKGIAFIVGCVLICLSIAFGILLPNPLSFFGLIAGGLLLILPKWVSVLLLLSIGLCGMVINLIIGMKRYEQAGG